MFTQKYSIIVSGAYTQVSVHRIADWVNLKNYPHSPTVPKERGGGSEVVKYAATGGFQRFQKKALDCMLYTSPW